ncbi:MAG: YkvA family protein [Candidatus Limimorpha sp.]
MVKDFFDKLVNNKDCDFDKDNNPNGSTSIPEDKIRDFLSKLGGLAKKVGVEVARKALQGFFLLLEIYRSPDVSVADKVLVVGVIFYIFKKSDLISDGLGLFGLLDDVSFSFLEYKRLKKIITPEMYRSAMKKAEDQLFDWGMVDFA